MSKAMLLCLLTTVMISMSVFAQSAATTEAINPAQPPVVTNEKAVIAGQPGDYAIITTNGQMVMKSYEIVGVKPEERSTLFKAFQRLLPKDGRGGTSEVSTFTRNGKELVLLTVTATKEMQASIAQTVDKINSGQIGKFNPAKKNVVYVPKFRSAESIAEAIRPELTNIGIVYVDKVLNAVTIEDDATYADWLLHDIAEVYDTKPPRIMAKVYIVEFIDGKDRNVGMDWQALFDALPSSISLSGDGGPAHSSLRETIVSSDSSSVKTSSQKSDGLRLSNFTAAVDQISPQALAGFLNYLETKGICKIVNSADVNVVNETPTVVSTKVGIATEATVSNDSGGNNRQEISAIEGIEVSIKGCLATEGNRLEVQATSTSVVSYSRKGIPLIATSNLNTAVTLPHNRTVTLSGLSRQKEAKIRYGLPLIGKKITETREWKLYICITVVDPPDVDVAAKPK